MTSAEHLFLSSSIVKELARLHGKIDGLVPAAVVDDVRAKFLIPNE
jgi:phosphopantetheine adenylyltransferase